MKKALTLLNIIYCQDWEKGRKKFYEIIDSLPSEWKSEMEISDNGAEICCMKFHGSLLQVVNTQYSHKGYKWTRCYVDEDLPDELIENIIIPDGQFHLKDKWWRELKFY